MNLKEKIKNALKWKKTSEYCAERLGITEEEISEKKNLKYFLKILKKVLKKLVSNTINK